MEKLKSISKWLLAAVMRSRRHEYIKTGKTGRDIIKIEMHSGEIYTGEICYELYKCIKCGNKKFISEGQDINYLSKCKRGDCV